MNKRPHWTTAVVVLLGLAGSLIAAGAAREVRDTNERRLLQERADSVAEILAGIAGGFEADLAAAAVTARYGSIEDFTAYARSASDDVEVGTWALIDRTADGFRVAATVPAGSPTYFDGPASLPVSSQLDAAFNGEFVVTGIFGEGAARRMGIASGVPGQRSERIVYLEFPLLAIAASGDESGPQASLWDALDIGLYVGTAPSADGLIFGTFEGAPPADAASVGFDAGGEHLLVIVAAKAPLSGPLADTLPKIVLAFGLTMTALAALVVELSRRQQRAAIAMAEELQDKHNDLENAVAEQARAEAGLREAQRREVVGQLAGGIAHDFNNLLAVIAGYAELAAERIDDPGAKLDLAEISGAAERGAALTRRLLLFARQDESGPETCDANLVIHDLGRLLERTVGEDIALVIDLGADRSTVPMSASELEQVVVNLVVNGRHAIPAAGLITIRTRTDIAAGTLVLEVADDGVGMTPDVASRAFDPMFSTRARGEGSGLGLSTVATIVNNARGTVTIDSAPGKGTTLRVVLPIASAGPDLAGVASSAQPTLGVERPLTVLLVEDDESVRRAMRRMLETRGYRVHESNSGLDAVDRMLDTCVPDVLVTDVVMPGGIGGPEVVHRFRTRNPDLPVVFVSGHAPDVIEGRTVPAGTGPVRMLAKPFSGRDLADALADAIADRGVRP